MFDIYINSYVSIFHITLYYVSPYPLQISEISGLQVEEIGTLTEIINHLGLLANDIDQ